MIDHLVYLVVQHLQIDELLFEYFYEALLPKRVELCVNNINDKRVNNDQKITYRQSRRYLRHILSTVWLLLRHKTTIDNDYRHVLVS
jgi:retron-type reverse transcriptase